MTILCSPRTQFWCLLAHFNPEMLQVPKSQVQVQVQVPAPQVQVQVQVLRSQVQVQVQVPETNYQVQPKYRYPLKQESSS